VWRLAAAELDAYQRAYGLDDPGPAKHVGGRVARDGRADLPAIPLAGERADGPASSGSAAAVASTRIAGTTAAGGRRWRPGSGTGSTPTGCWAPNPAGRRPATAATGRTPGSRSSAWPAGTTTARTATSGIRTATDPAGASTTTSAAPSATAGSWQKGAAHAPAPRPQPPRGP
jgi:hypothetical protein